MNPLLELPLVESFVWTVVITRSDDRRALSVVMTIDVTQLDVFAAELSERSRHSLGGCDSGVPRLVGLWVIPQVDLGNRKPIERPGKLRMTNKPLAGLLCQSDHFTGVIF